MKEVEAGIDKRKRKKGNTVSLPTDEFVSAWSLHWSGGGGGGGGG